MRPGTHHRDAVRDDGAAIPRPNAGAAAHADEEDDVHGPVLDGVLQALRRLLRGQGRERGGQHQPTYVRAEVPRADPTLLGGHPADGGQTRRPLRDEELINEFQLPHRQPLRYVQLLLRRVLRGPAGAIGL